MVGAACVRELRSLGALQLILRSRDQLDLTRQADVEDFFAEERPDIVVFAAARVGGIQANATYPAEFAYDNLAMAANVIHAAHRNGTQRLLFLGSTCIYPRVCPQPILEDYLLTGPLEPTNEAYAIAKIAGLKLCQYYRHQYGHLFHSAMPTNLYGPGDNYHSEHSHVAAALLRRFHEASEACSDAVTVWGTGTPKREFLHVEDMARAVVHLLLLENPPDWINIGTGKAIRIRELAEMIASITGYVGRIEMDPSRPDGTPIKVCNIDRIRATGWEPRIGLREGLTRTYSVYQQEVRRKELRAN